MVDTQKLIEIFVRMNEIIQRSSDYLTELDTPIGDGDMGANLARGFKAVMEKLPAMVEKDPGYILKVVGMTLASAVGGNSGVLYGSAFMKAGAAAVGKTELDIGSFIYMLSEAITEIQRRGRASLGDKTMLDAMIPALDAIKAAEGTPAQVLAEGLKAAQAGAEGTIEMKARWGTAAYFGERSIGHKDPGAESFALLLSAITECCG